MALNTPVVIIEDPGRGGLGTIPPQCGGNVAKRQKGTARVRGGQSAPQRGIFKGAGAPLNGLLHPFLPEEKDGPGVLGGGPNAPYAGTSQVR